MNDIVIKQREFFNSNQTKDIDFRVQQLKKLRNLLKDNESLLTQVSQVKKQSIDVLKSI